MTTGRVDVLVRPAGADDLEAIARISLANDEPVADPDRPGSRYLEHLLGHARLLVAETDAGVVGFAGAIDTPPGWFLTDLFVDPAAQGHGIGRALLAEALPDDGPRLTFSSSDPRAHAALHPGRAGAVVAAALPPAAGRGAIRTSDAGARPGAGRSRPWSRRRRPSSSAS